MYSQDYLWPIKAEKKLTAVFGEERPGRYHTGIDVRTFGETGYPLLAIDSGYISRIRTSSKKYGKSWTWMLPFWGYSEAKLEKKRI